MILCQSYHKATTNNHHRENGDGADIFISHLLCDATQIALSRLLMLWFQQGSKTCQGQSVPNESTGSKYTII